MSAKRLTPKQRVLRVYRNAYSCDYGGIGWSVFPEMCAAYLQAIGFGITENKAWADAASRLTDRGRK